mgnify:CR=1 FL=1
MHHPIVFKEITTFSVHAEAKTTAIVVAETEIRERCIDIEPQVFYKLSVNDFTQGSEIGMRIGLGFYF